MKRRGLDRLGLSVILMTLALTSLEAHAQKRGEDGDRTIQRMQVPSRAWSFQDVDWDEDITSFDQMRDMVHLLYESFARTSIPSRIRFNILNEKPFAETRKRAGITKSTPAFSTISAPHDTDWTWNIFVEAGTRARTLYLLMHELGESSSSVKPETGETDLSDSFMDRRCASALGFQYATMAHVGASDPGFASHPAVAILNEWEPAQQLFASVARRYQDMYDHRPSREEWVRICIDARNYINAAPPSIIQRACPPTSEWSPQQEWGDDPRTERESQEADSSTGEQSSESGEVQSRRAPRTLTAGIRLDVGLESEANAWRSFSHRLLRFEHERRTLREHSPGSRPDAAILVEVKDSWVRFLSSRFSHVEERDIPALYRFVIKAPFFVQREEAGLDTHNKVLVSELAATLRDLTTIQRYSGQLPRKTEDSLESAEVVLRAHADRARRDGSWVENCPDDLEFGVHTFQQFADHTRVVLSHSNALHGSRDTSEWVSFYLVPALRKYNPDPSDSSHARFAGNIIEHAYQYRHQFLTDSWIDASEYARYAGMRERICDMLDEALEHVEDHEDLRGYVDFIFEKSPEHFRREVSRNGHACYKNDAGRRSYEVTTMREAARAISSFSVYLDGL